MYFLIHCSEDGDVSVTKYEKDALLSAIKDNYYGDIGFFNKMPDKNMMYWGNKVLIIKGKIVTPKSIEDAILTNKCSRQETLNRLWHCAECGTGYFEKADAVNCCR